MDINERSILSQYLHSQYDGVFKEKHFDRYIRDYIGLAIADEQVDIIMQICKGKKLLDIGSGFGSFVLAARKRGFDAKGIELSSYEVEFARKRIQKT